MGMMYSSASLSGVREKATLLKRRQGVKREVLTATREGKEGSVGCGGGRWERRGEGGTLVQSLREGGGKEEGKGQNDAVL